MSGEVVQILIGWLFVLAVYAVLVFRERKRK